MTKAELDTAMAKPTGCSREQPPWQDHKFLFKFFFNFFVVYFAFVITKILASSIGPTRPSEKNTALLPNIFAIMFVLSGTLIADYALNGGTRLTSSSKKNYGKNVGNLFLPKKTRVPRVLARPPTPPPFTVKLKMVGIDGGGSGKKREGGP